MHGIHGSIQKRIEAVARRLGAAPLPETDAETSRRHELVHSAHAGEMPANLTEEEVLTFAKIKASMPVFEELINEGLVDGHGQPAEPTVLLVNETEDGRQDEDGEGDEDGQEFVWAP